MEIFLIIDQSKTENQNFLSVTLFKDKIKINKKFSTTKNFKKLDILLLEIV